MKAFIFAAGLGSRLGAITESCPKALVEGGGEPMIKRVILKLIDAGISKFVINIHHHADMIVSYLKGNNDFGAKIAVSDERDMLLDTGGALVKAKNLLAGDEPILLHNADILTDFDINRMVDKHLKNHDDATLLVDRRKTSRYLLFDKEMRMKGWTDIRTNEIRTPWPTDDCSQCDKFAFGGVHIINPSIFDSLETFSEDPKFSITPFYTASCRKLRIAGYVPDQTYHWIDIGKPDSLMAAQNIVSKLQLKVQAE